MFKGSILLIMFLLILSSIGCTSVGTRAPEVETATPVPQAPTAVPSQPMVMATDAATPAVAPTLPAPTPTLPMAADVSQLATPTVDISAPTAAVSPAQGTCTYRASFVADVTVPDSSAVAPGANFVKTWRLRNDGTCTWGYAGSGVHRLVWVGGNRLSAPNAVELPFPQLGQGGTVDISVAMVAPTAPGAYQSQWRLQLDNGTQVGVGPNGDTPLYAQIIVPAPTAATHIPAWNSFKSPRYRYTIAYPSEIRGQVENAGMIGDAQQVERVIFRLPNKARPDQSSVVIIEAAQHSYSRPVQCQVVDNVVPGVQGCRLSLPQPQGTSQELVWFRVPMWVSGQEYLYFSLQLTYEDVKHVAAFTYMLQSFKYIPLPVTVPPPGTCTYRAAFVADVSIPDNTILDPGTHFTKTWRVRNEGTCTWGYAGYALHRLVFVGGDPLGAPASVELPFPELGPGGMADISVPMVAPMNPRTYTGNWRLQVDNGQQVGIGPNGDAPFYVRIIVPGPIPPPTPTPMPPPSPVWNTWSGSKHHYAVDLPATWTIDVQSFQPQGPGHDPEAAYLRPPYAQWAMVQISALKGAPPIKGYENCVKNLTFRGVPACSIVRSNDPVPHRILVFQKGESYYHIEGWYNTPQQLEVFDDIVKSFRFVP